jgi:SSS family solute:Na+ symporter
MLLGFIIAYLVITLLLGLGLSKFIKSSSDYALAGKRMPVLITASALFATWFGSETVMGASSVFAEKGLISVIEDPFGAALCLFLLGAFFAKNLYNLNLITMGDFFAKRFGPRAETLAAIFMILSYFTWTSAQLIAFAKILTLITGLSEPVGIWLSGLLVFAYTFAGGMLAITITDFIQTIVIIIGLAFITCSFVGQAGGLETLVLEQPKNFWKFTPANDFKSMMEYINAWLIISLGSIPQQDVFQRIMSAKDSKTSVASCYLGSIMYLSVAALPLIIAIAAKKIYPDLHGESLLITAVMRQGDTLTQVMFFGALMSAIMSTASGSILAPATTFAENILKPSLKNVSDKKLLWLMRASVAIMSLAGILLSFTNSSIYELVGMSSALSLVALLVPLVAGLWWKPANEIGATVSMLLGIGVWAIYEFMIPSIIPAMLLGLFASIIGMIAGSKFKTA